MHFPGSTGTLQMEIDKSAQVALGLLIRYQYAINKIGECGILSEYKRQETILKSLKYLLISLNAYL